MVGIHKQVGEVRKQDEAFTIEVILELKLLLESEWKRTADEEKKTEN